MNIYNIEPANTDDYDQIITVWEESVRATHDFLDENDLILYKKLIYTQYLDMVNLHCIKIQGKIAGFMGTAEKSIEMLFAHPSWFGKGIGKALTRFAIQELGCTAVDVNEQNSKALQFYINMGFAITGRSEMDGLKKPYPLLHMALNK